MSITTTEELQHMKAIGEIVGKVLKEMQAHVKAGMTAKELDDFGGTLLQKYGAQSAPKVTYGFPGFTCICVNHEIAHGIPTEDKIFQEGDLINIDVSAEKNGYFGDNGASFVLGKDLHGHGKLVEASRAILKKALASVRSGSRINQVGKIIEKEANKAGFTVIRNLAGHGVGRSLHEEPGNILNYQDRWNRKRFPDNCVVAIETFISTASTIAEELEDGWTLVGNKGGFVAQHEHTVVVTKDGPVLLTEANGIFA